ncbi:FMN-binding negative transcriptional regulator [bacterium]|nr:MAG: FMN-binding negative transcriptional regulator [bacterium]
MYTPKSFRLEDPALIAQIIDANSFGTLVSHGEGGLLASHLPYEFDATRNVLRCHMARANPQWRDFGDADLLSIFQDAHGYISPRWYQKDLIPTWNYVTVHVYGKARILENEDDIADLLEKLVAKYDSFQVADEDRLRIQGAIVAFEIEISRIEAKAKMSQNRSRAEIPGIIAGLEENGQNELARWVRQLNDDLTLG